MRKYNAVIVGATGLIGRHLLQFLLSNPTFEKITALNRRNPEISHPKLDNKIVDFQNVENLKQAMGTGDIIFCCVGTTQKKVGRNKDLYREVDYNIPVNLAQAAAKNGFEQYALVSSVGANPNSSNFYLKLKGETEEAVSRHPFKAIHLFRPSILIGKRDEPRLGEELSGRIMQFFSALLLGGYKKYRPVEARVVALALSRLLERKEEGIHIYMYQEIQELANLNRS